MFIIKQLIKLIQLLHKDEGAFALALGLSLSIFPGFAGYISVLGFLSLIIVIFFRVQMGAYFIGYFFFSLMSLLLNSLFNKVGLYLLLNKSLEPLWQNLYGSPTFHWFRFNHSLVMGGQVLGLALFPVFLAAFYFLILKYQRTVAQKLRETKFYKSFLKFSLVIKYNNVIKSIKG